MEQMEQQAEDMGLVQEEIHGVHCVAPKETEELIRDSLRELHNCLESNDIIPEDGKKPIEKARHSNPPMSTRTTFDSGFSDAVSLMYPRAREQWSSI